MNVVLKEVVAACCLASPSSRDSSNEEEPDEAAWCNGAGADRTLGVAKFCIAWRKFCMGGTRLINLRPLK